MAKKLNLGSIKIPIASATKGIGMIGKRGSGKSYGAAVFAEELWDVKIPFVVFDPIDVWWGLKVSADGKEKGLPIVVFGKEHADIQLNRTMGKRIADAVVKDNISCVISTFGMNKTEMREVIADFSERILQINNTPRQVIIEEAHEFVPQRVQGAMARCFSAVEALLVMGRNRGIGVTLLNQRMATLNKDLLTQIDVLVAFRSVGPQDRKAFRDWVEVHNVENDAIFDEFMRSVPSLPTGTAWVWSPEFLEVFEKVKFRKRTTFHPDREKLGMTFKMPEIKQGDIQEFIEKFSKKPEVRTIVNAPRSMGKVSGYTASKVELAQEYKRGYGEGEISGIQKGTSQTDKKYKALLEKCRQLLMRTHGDVDKALEMLKLEHSDYISYRNAASPRAHIHGTRPDVVIIDEVDAGEKKKLTGGAKRMMNVLASKYPMKFTRSQLAIQSNMKARGGGFNNYLAIIKGNGYAIEEGDYLQATHEGIDYAGVAPSAPQTSDDMRLMWREKLTGKGKEMFDIICDLYPTDISREELASRVGMVFGGGGFNNYLGTMRSNGLVSFRGDRVRASEHLFEV